ncbi:stage V sporulation protein AA [Cytobacillus oceanisediminis]|uniref:Stage V sporulation protein AA n=2 Tax=Niallia TaxID=2837506 RepID=A0A941JH46_NIACI|nr:MULTISPECIES: stage V sporulation protein AA [Bacillaceae]MBQ6447385.1 stage V sporulation protein AA [Bacillus sp. (in: firmicutes)]MDU1844311.1 stage V sporulation protein AA [Niallia nealsonii]MBZ9533907.1 stage V sporulation protein AA [Cytobacillus oceanisediminis]MCB5238784.1 stage V sporulation protein AA [Niallia circulans]MED3792224.1 stage V sporulation protein AA [Niallia alba]
MAETIYLRMRHRIQKKSNDRIFLKDLAQIIATDELLSTLKNVCLYHISAQDKNIIIIDSTQVIREIKRLDKEVDIQLIGPPQTIIEVVFEKRKVTLPFFILVWLLLFIGSGLTIMNFHEDVSMQTVHQRVYKMITGKEVEKPLIFQIPYSIGLGLGMVIFFNHVFKKRLNEEPSPLEVEVFNYQQSLDQYMIMHENKESIKKLDDH